MSDLIIEEEVVQLPIVVRPINIGDVVNDKYEVKKELGEGGFGLVFEVIDRRNNEHLAMKVELFEPKHDEPGLKLESSALRRLQGYNHILKYHDEGSLDSIGYLVMQLAGSSLADLRRFCPNKCFSPATALKLSMETLEAIENVHRGGLLHRDIKPGNFAVGVNENSKIIYILDFGLVRRYISKKGKVRSARKFAGFRGSIRYASLNAHKNLDLGRRDDLWSWIYTVVEFCKGDLPWAHQMSKKLASDAKEKITKDVLLANMPDEFGLVFCNLQQLLYDSSPPYPTYRNLLMGAVKRNNFSLTAPYDWEIGGIHYEHTRNVEPQRFSKLDRAVHNVSKRDHE